MTWQQTINKQLNRLDKLLCIDDPKWLAAGYWEGFDRFFKELQIRGWKKKEKYMDKFRVEYDYLDDCCLCLYGNYQDSDNSTFMLVDYYRGSRTVIFEQTVPFISFDEFISTTHLYTPSEAVYQIHPELRPAPTYDGPTVLDFSAALEACSWSNNIGPTATKAFMQKQTHNGNSTVVISMENQHITLQLNKSVTITDMNAWNYFYEKYLCDSEY